MSANGAFTTTLDFQYFGGGYVQVSGPVSVSIDPIFESIGLLPVSGELQPQTLSFSLAEAGIETPTIQGIAENLTISFDMNQSGFIEFGVQRYASAEWGSLIVPFTANSEGYSVVSGTFNNVLEFTSDTNIYVFSEGPALGSIPYFVAGKGTNVSSHIYDKIGANYVDIDGVDHNDVHISVQSNAVKIIDNGIRQAEIIQN